MRLHTRKNWNTNHAVKRQKRPLDRVVCVFYVSMRENFRIYRPELRLIE